jgi:hypothetical protein
LQQKLWLHVWLLSKHGMPSQQKLLQLWRTRPAMLQQLQLHMLRHWQHKKQQQQCRQLPPERQQPRMLQLQQRWKRPRGMPAMQLMQLMQQQRQPPLQQSKALQAAAAWQLSCCLCCSRCSWSSSQLHLRPIITRLCCSIVHLPKLMTGVCKQVTLQQGQQQQGQLQPLLLRYRAWRAAAA